MNIFKFLFVLLLVKPLVHIGLGLNIINRQNLPLNGPAIVAANHNSHLDTLVLLALFPISMIHKIRPVAAADYFLKSRLSTWLSLNVLGIIPIKRTSREKDRESVFDECHRAIEQGEILLIFPEGSRGSPEIMGDIKKGIFHLVNQHEYCPVIPVVMRGLGHALPKGTAMFVPFNCDVVFGPALNQFEGSEQFLHIMQGQYEQLAQKCIVTQYDG